MVYQKIQTYILKNNGLLLPINYCLTYTAGSFNVLYPVVQPDDIHILLNGLPYNIYSESLFKVLSKAGFSLFFIHPTFIYRLIAECLVVSAVQQNSTFPIIARCRFENPPTPGKIINQIVVDYTKGPRHAHV